MIFIFPIGRNRCVAYSLTLPDPMEIVPRDSESAAAAAATESGASANGVVFDMAAALVSLDPDGGVSPPAWRLYIVLDTNVLLSRATLRLLEQLGRRFGPGSGGALEVVAIIPWTVLLELDSLKVPRRAGMEGGSSRADVTVQARAAIAALRAALDSKERFYQ